MVFHSTHKFRHGNAVFSIKHADNIVQLKAISQNLMHANISITDGIYGGLSDKDIKEQITSLTNKLLSKKEYSKEDLLKLTEQLIDLIEN